MRKFIKSSVPEIRENQMILCKLILWLSMVKYYDKKTVITCFIIWLAPRAGKMKRIPCSDWLPERARWAYLARSGLPALDPQKRNSFGVIFGHIINLLLTKLVRSRWLDIDLL